MRGRLQERLTRFSGGVRDTDATFSSAGGGKITGVPAQSSRTQGARGRIEELAAGTLDMTYDRRTGLLRRRNGHQSMVSTAAIAPASENALFPAAGLPAGDANQLLLHVGSGIYSYSAGAGLSAAVITGLTNRNAYAVQAPQSGGQGPVYIANGSQLRYWTGAVAGTWTAASGTLPVGRYMVWHGTRVWIAGFTVYGGLLDPKSGLAWSDLGDPRAWPAANVTMFDPNDGDEITGVGRIGSYLLVFKRRKTWLVYDLDTGANRQLSAGLGCVSHRTITETAAGTYFLSERGMAVCDGSTIKLLEDKANLISRIDLSYSTEELGRIFGVTLGDDYLLGDVAAPGRLWQYDLLNDAWWPSTRPMRAAAAWDDGTTGPSLWGYDDTARKLTRLFGHAGSDQRDYGATAIDAVAALRALDFGSDNRKRLRSLVVEGNARLLASVTPDGVDASGVLSSPVDVSSAGTGRGIVPRPAALQPWRRLGVELQADSSFPTSPFEVAAVTVHADATQR